MQTETVFYPSFLSEQMREPVSPCLMYSKYICKYILQLIKAIRTELVAAEWQDSSTRTGKGLFSH